MPSSEYLSTLEKGLKVLKCFSRERPQMTLSEVAKVTDLSPAVARRCLLTLCELGYVGKDGNQYMLQPRVLEFSNAFSESFDIDNLIRPALQTLREATGDSASFAVLQDSEVLYICHVSAYRVVRLQATAGTRFPALITSLGRAVLSTLSDDAIEQHIAAYPVQRRTDKTVTDPDSLKALLISARGNGYAVTSDELDYGITSIACPIILASGQVAGAINCSAATSRVDESTFTTSRLEPLLHARDDIVNQFGRAPELLRALKSGVS